MSNSKKLEQDAAKHRGFEKSIKDGAHPINLVPSIGGPIQGEVLERLRKAWQLQIQGIHNIFSTPIIESGDFDGIPDFIIKLDRPIEFMNINIALDDCSHTNKRKEGIHKLFWVCNDCKKDLGDV